MMKRIIFLVLLTIPLLVFSERSTGLVDTKETTYAIQVTASASSYQIYVDGNVIQGNRTKITAGEHTIVVKANGFKDWKEIVNIDKNTKIYANMVPNTFKLSINTNVGKSRIYIDNQERGTGNFSADLNPGTYTIVVRSGGFMDYKATINLDRDVSINATLKPLTAKVRVNIPKSILNTKSKSALNDIIIYVDGKAIKGFNFEVNGGNHLIRIESGGLAIENQYDFMAGRNYTIEPMISMGIE